jgi:hypothetical protein
MTEAAAPSGSLRGLPASIARDCFNKTTLVLSGVALVLGLALPPLIHPLLGRATGVQPMHVMLASHALHLFAIGLVLMLLPSQTARRPWGNLGAWLAGNIVFLTAMLGLRLSPAAGSESLKTFLSLAALVAAQAAVICAINALLTIWTGANLARQFSLLLAAVMCSALFWSKGAIEATKGAGNVILTNGVKKLSPPIAAAGIWHQHSDAARSGAGEAKFDIILGHITYGLWVGSNAGPYPEFFPPQAGEEIGKPFHPGLILAMLLWGLPLLLLGDLLLTRQTNPQSAPFGKN